MQHCIPEKIVIYVPKNCHKLEFENSFLVFRALVCINYFLIRLLNDIIFTVYSFI